MSKDNVILNAAILMAENRLLRTTQKMKNASMHRLEMLMFSLSMVIWWAITKYASLKRKYAGFIEFLEAGACMKDPRYQFALASPGSVDKSLYGDGTMFPNSQPIPDFWPPGVVMPSYVHSSALWIAMAVEYPILSTFRFQNGAFPIAVYKAYSNSCFYCVMSRVDACHAGASHIPLLFTISNMCSFRPESGVCGADTIICDAFRHMYYSRQNSFPACTVNPPVLEQCLGTCQMLHRDLNMSSAAQTTAALQGGTSFAFVGQSVGGTAGSEYAKAVGKSAAETEGASAVGGLVAGAALGMIGAALNSALYQQGVTNARKDCGDSLQWQMCSNKSDFCQWNPDDGGGGGWLSSLGRALGGEETTTTATTPGKAPSNLSPDRVSQCLVYNAETEKIDTTGQYFANRSNWQWCCNPLATPTEDDGLSMGPTEGMASGSPTRVNSCLPQHCVTRSTEQCFVSKNYTPAYADFCKADKVCKANPNIICESNEDCPKDDVCNTIATTGDGVYDESSRNGCELSTTTYWGCSRGVKQWIIDQKQSSFARYKVPKFM